MKFSIRLHNVHCTCIQNRFLVVWLYLQTVSFVHKSRSLLRRPSSVLFLWPSTFMYTFQSLKFHCMALPWPITWSSIYTTQRFLHCHTVSHLNEFISNCLQPQISLCGNFKQISRMTIINNLYISHLFLWMLKIYKNFHYRTALTIWADKMPWMRIHLKLYEEKQQLSGTILTINSVKV